ncbi:RNA-binding ribosome biosynthesis protein mak21 [Coemansia sp. RSA 1843]|nr:RNA-binding ribosome biosynthesis protein mak21 [Coemansia sp. RSA 1843]
MARKSIKGGSATVTAAPAKKEAKGTKKGDSSELWDEIQKLGGDMEDLNMLQNIDTDKPGKPGKSKKIDKAVLQSDLSVFAKSLGLSTSISDMVGDADKEKVSEHSKRNSSEPKQNPKDSKKDTKNKKKGNVEKKAPEAKEKNAKVESKKDAKPRKKPSSNDDSDKEETTKVPEIPGFKIKSAKDAAPRSKAGKLTIQPTRQWFAISTKPLEVDEEAERLSEEEVLQKLEFAEYLLNSENDIYENKGIAQKSLSTADRSFVSNILSAGTLTDRVSALTLIVQESPLHNLKSLGQLMQMVSKKNRREALLAVGSVKDLMCINLLPADRKLKYFAEQPLNAKEITNTHWILWAFEDKLKRHYFDLIQAMESLAYDPLVHTRQSMVSYFEELLEQKPEQEQNLLRLLVNKLGDKERQLAAKASYLILKLLNVHPNMKFVVVKTVQELLLTKSSTNERAQYYTMITLNQVILSSKDVQTANLLLEVYFVFFKKLLKLTQAMDGDETEDNEDKPKKDSSGKRPERKQKVYIGQKALKKAKQEAAKKRDEEEKAADNKMLAAILTGLNRALPFSKMEDEAMDKHVGSIFQIAHAGNFNTVVQSLVLLHQIMRMRPAIADRFYRTLYDSLLDPRIDSTSKKAMYLNILFRALKSDENIPRVMSFVKRILQACLHTQPEFASGALFLVSQILSLQPRAYSMLTQPEDNDDEEKFVNAKDSSDDDDESKQAQQQQQAKSRYDPLKRDPRFTHADDSCLWEAVMLVHHFHPSITHSMKQIINGEQVPAINNLHNHSLAHFLDRFVFRKPKAGADGSADADGDGDGDMNIKKFTGLRGQSIMQPLIYQDGPDMEVGPGSTRIAAGNYLLASKRVGGVVGGIDFTSEKIASLRKSDVLPEEQFFHQFFETKKERMGKKSKKSKKKSGNDEDAASGDEGPEFADDNTGFAAAVKGGEDDGIGEDEIWQAMTGSMPKAGGDDDDDDDDMEEEDGDDDDLLAALGEDESDLEDEGESDGDSDDGSDDADEFPNFDDEISDNELSADSDSSTQAGAKRKSSADVVEEDKKEKSSKRKRGERLPLFGSFDDYAHLIDNDEGLA